MHRTPLARLALGAALLLPASGAFADDTVLLKDGRTIDCPKIEKQDGKYRLQFKNGEIFVPADVVKEALISGVEGYEPKDDDEKAKLAKGLVPFEGKWVAKAERDATVAKRTAAAKKKIEEAKAHREWRNRYKTKTQNFDFEYTIPPEIAKGYMDLMETYFSVFTKQFGITRDPKRRLTVCFYHDYDTFLEVSGAPRGVLAYYAFDGPRPRELNFYYDRIRPQETAAIMFHEAQHYLAHLIELPFRYPHNFSESMAEYFGGSIWDAAKKSMSTGGVQEGRLTEVLTDLQRGDDKKLEDFIKNTLDYDDYTWGWSFCHFMMETPKYAAKYKQFYLALAKGKDVTRTDQGGMLGVAGDQLMTAFQKIMGVKDIAALDAEWHDYIKNKLKLTSAVGFEEAAFAAEGTGREIKAKKYYDLAIEKGTKNPLVYLRYGRMISWKEKDRALELFKKGLEVDPTNADLYAAMGRTMRGQKGDENDTEGRRLLKLAEELDPDNVDLSMLIEDALEKAKGGDDKTGN